MKGQAMKNECIECIKADTGTDAKKPAWKVWGTREYEESLAARYPDASQDTINSLIAVTRRIAENKETKQAVIT